MGDNRSSLGVKAQEDGLAPEKKDDLALTKHLGSLVRLSRYSVSLVGGENVGKAIEVRDVLQLRHKTRMTPKGRSLTSTGLAIIAFRPVPVTH
jgi:hypothetical protein